MNKARQVINDVLAQAEAPALLWSGGKDSALILSLIREISDIPLIWFRSGADEAFHSEEIRQQNLTVWSWGAADSFVLPNGDDFSLVHEYAFGPDRLPVVSDIEPGEKCVFEFNEPRTAALFPHFDALFIGYRDCDSHPVVGRNYCPPDGWRLGKAKVFAPLRHLSDEAVEAEVARRGIRVASATDVHACTLCLHGEPVRCPKNGKVIEVDWEPQTSLLAFRQRYGLENAHA